MDIWDVAVEACFGIIIRQKAYILNESAIYQQHRLGAVMLDLELPPEDVCDEDDGFGSGLVRGFGDVAVKSTNVVFAATWRPFVDGAGYAAL